MIWNYRLQLTRFFTAVGCVLLLCSTAFGEKRGDKLSPVDFLNIVRHPSGRKTWAMMNGKVEHMRRGQQAKSCPLYLGILFAPDRTLAQIVIDNLQGYMVGQVYSEAESGTTIIPLNKTGYPKSLLAEFGLRPQDLTMTFLYWKFISEQKRVSIKTTECRVFDLQSPDKKEIARVYISCDYFFPLKVEWLKQGEKEAYRHLEVAAFKKLNDLWLVSKLKIYGPGWRSRVEFTDNKAGFVDKDIPTGLFRELPADKK
jgi:hypothetical protein